MTPLLVAVSTKRIDLISEFFLACPESIVDANVNGQNALHIAVKNDDQREGLSVLKVLMGWILRLCQKDAEWIETRVMNRRDKDGNTALHLAVYENNLQAMKLMLESSKINVNLENKNGLTVLDIAALHNNREMERIVKRHGGKHAVSLVEIKTTSDVLGSRLTWRESRRTKMIRFYSCISEERRNALLVVATLIITATYQTVLQPPGGVSDGGGQSIGMSGPKAGSVVMDEGYFIWLWLWNTAGFCFAVYMMLGLLSIEQENMFCYYPLFIPLVVAYFVGGEVIKRNAIAFRVAGAGAIVVLIIWGLVVGFWEWLQFRRTKLRGPKSGLVWEGFTTLDQARGVAPNRYGIR